MKICYIINLKFISIPNIKGNISGANQLTCVNLETTNQDHQMLIQWMGWGGLSAKKRPAGGGFKRKKITPLTSFIGSVSSDPDR